MWKPDAPLNLTADFKIFKPTKILVQNDMYTNIDCAIESLCKSFVGDPSYGRNQPAVQ